MTGDSPRGVNDFLYGKSDTVAEIEYIALAAAHQIIHGKNVCLCQVGHMDVVADAGAVLGVVIVDKNGDNVTLSIRYL